MDGPRIKQFWNCNPTPSNHKIMKIIIAKNFFYHAHKLTILLFLRQSAWKLEKWKLNALKSPKLWKLCVQNVIKAISRNKCLSIVMKLTGYLISELFILLSNNQKCNIIIFPDCPEVRDSKPRLTPCWSAHGIWKIYLEKSSSTNLIFSLFRTWFLQQSYQQGVCFPIFFSFLKFSYKKLFKFQ